MLISQLQSFAELTQMLQNNPVEFLAFSFKNAVLAYHLVFSDYVGVLRVFSAFTVFHLTLILLFREILDFH